MSTENDPNEPKLIIDEDWKEQVQREKQQATQQGPQSPTGDQENNNVAEANSGQADDDSDNSQMPEASFEMLVTMLATQALIALGQMPESADQPTKIQKPVAKHFIDLLGVLEEKTKGNLEANQERMLREILHNLRMTFVLV